MRKNSAAGTIAAAAAAGTTLLACSVLRTDLRLVLRAVHRRWKWQLAVHHRNDERSVVVLVEHLQSIHRRHWQCSQWNRVQWNRVQWNQVQWNQVQWNQVQWSEQCCLALQMLVAWDHVVCCCLLLWVVLVHHHLQIFRKNAVVVFAVLAAQQKWPLKVARRPWR